MAWHAQTLFWVTIYCLSPFNYCLLAIAIILQQRHGIQYVKVLNC
jgi:hypothetical protein